MKMNQKNKEILKKLKKLSAAYKSAEKNDYCEAGEYQGLAPHEIASRIIATIDNLEYKE